MMIINLEIFGINYQFSDSLWRPRVHPPTVYYADQLQLFVHPSLEKFEAELIKQLDSDRRDREGALASTASTRIVERRIRVGLVCSEL